MNVRTTTTVCLSLTLAGWAAIAGCSDTADTPSSEADALMTGCGRDGGTRHDAATPPVDSGGTPTDPTGGSGPCALPHFPNASCTGVPTGTQLQRVPQDVTSGPGWVWVAGDAYLKVTGDGAVIDGKDVSGIISVEAVGVTVKRSKARGITTSQSERARSSSSTRLTIQDAEVVCDDSDGSTGIGDKNFTVVRTNIHGCENGFDLDSDGTISDSYIHDLHQSVIAHTDGLQSAVGSNIVIDHNTFFGDTFGACGSPSGHTSDCGGTSAININANPAGPTSSNTTVSNNLLAGGAYTLYCPAPKTTNFKVFGNHWSRTFYPKGGAFGPQDGCLNDDGTPRVTEWSANVWDDTGLPVGP